ncbi:MAG: hypothetical protein ABSF34_19470, partial [Verrucomicrobiota bacterium]
SRWRKFIPKSAGKIQCASESLSENDETCCFGNCFLSWHSFQPSERVVPESNGNRFSLSLG